MSNQPISTNAPGPDGNDFFGILVVVLLVYIAFKLGVMYG